MKQVTPRLYAKKGVKIRDYSATAPILRAQGATKSIVVKDAVEQDRYEEYLVPIISIEVLEGVNVAIAHINQYGTSILMGSLPTTTMRTSFCAKLIEHGQVPCAWPRWD